MSSILVLKLSSDREVVERMSSSVRDILNSKGLTFDEVTIDTVTDMNVALAYFIESSSYEGAICLGYCYPRFKSPMFETMYNQAISSIVDFSSYYTFPVGLGVIFNNTEKISNKVIDAHITQIANATSNLVLTIRQLNNADTEQYARNKRHN
jgi:6,7-dimethyl-8-ribityllumazine synthase